MEQELRESSGLISTTDPNPILSHGSDRISPFVVVCDHAGKAVPKRLKGLGLADELVSDHIGWDIDAWPLAAELADRLGAPAIGQAYSRLVIDCNRRRDVVGSMAASSDGIPVPGNLSLSQRDRDRRAGEIMVPYQTVIGTRIEMARRMAWPCIVSVHSCTPRLRDGAWRPWQVGVISGPDARMKKLVLRDLRAVAPSLEIGNNQPYQVDMEGDYTLPCHAEANGLPYVEFEVRNDCFVDGGERAWICAILAGSLLRARRRLQRENGRGIAPSVQGARVQ